MTYIYNTQYIRGHYIVVVLKVRIFFLFGCMQVLYYLYGVVYYYMGYPFENVSSLELTGQDDQQ